MHRPAPHLARLVAVLGLLLTTLVAIGPATAAPPTAPSQASTSGQLGAQPTLAAECTATNCPSWGYWKCGAGSLSTFTYRCYTWVRYDYCGGSRMNTVNQYTKMKGQFRILNGLPPGISAIAIYPWASRGDTGAVTRRYVWGQRSATVAVWTTVKPDNKPYISCTLG